jgi:phosphoglycerol transferase MdoB-like AlkP superfamily enzyme
MLSLLFNGRFYELATPVLILSLVVVFISETFIWLVLDTRPKKFLSYLRPWWFVLNVMVIFSSTSLVYSITDHLFLSGFLVFLIAQILVAAHITKFKILGIPAFFWDYTVLKEPLLYIPSLIQKKSTMAVIASVIACFVTALYFVLKLPAHSVPLLYRITFLASSVLAVALYYRFAKVPYHKFFPANSFRDSIVFKTGLFSFMVLTARHSKTTPPPEGYNKESVIEITKNYAEDEQEKEIPLSDELPNIIFYSVESLMDLESLGVEMENSPTPFFTSLTEKTGKSFFVSPTFGGQTVQPEFELLTGLSQYHLSVPNPFLHIIDKFRRFPALSTGFKDAGYYCLGVQAVSAHEFQRRRYYPIIDFDRFVALESDYAKEEWELIHHLLSDDYLIKKIKENLPGEENPLFGLFLNNSTHASYFKWDKKEEYRVLNSNYSDKSKDILERYASAIHHADQALAKLVAHFEQQSRKTIIVIFGDHLPGLASVFDDIKPFQGDKNYLKFRTPMRIWSNFDLPKGDRVVSANLLMAFLVDLLKLDLLTFPSHFQLVREIFKNVDVLSGIIQDKQGIRYSRQNPPEYLEKLIHEYNMIQYDLLEGKRYSLQGTKFSN